LPTKPYAPKNIKLNCRLDSTEFFFATTDRIIF